MLSEEEAKALQDEPETKELLKELAQLLRVRRHGEQWDGELRSVERAFQQGLDAYVESRFQALCAERGSR